MAYIRRFYLYCPVENCDDVEGMADITGLDLHVFELKTDLGAKSVIRNLLPNFLPVLKACRQTEIVHSDGAGWAFPLTFYILPISFIVRFKWVIVIESSFWMIEPGEKRTARRLIEHLVHKILLTLSLQRASARIFTQSFYRNYSLGERTDRTLINPANWVDQAMMADRTAVVERFRARGDAPIRLILPSRLEEDKGILVALDAIKILATQRRPIEITIMGTGKLEQHCRSFAESQRGCVKVTFVQPVPYDKRFFEKLSEHDFVLVPTLKQEQPRIVFDAFSQGVAVIGSDTSGIWDITSRRTAMLFSRGDANDLAVRLTSTECSRAAAMEMGLAGLEYAFGKNHRQMHLDREAFLKPLIH